MSLEKEIVAVTQDSKTYVELGYMSISEGNWDPGCIWEEDGKYLDEPKLRTDLPKDEIVIEEDEIDVVFSYPLSSDFTFTFSAEGGFTREEISNMIMKKYADIYQEEEDTSNIEAGNHEKFVLNRNQTDGKYGIWGHGIGDLMLHSMMKENGKWSLGVDS